MDTATSSLKRVVVGRRAKLDFVLVARFASSSTETAFSFSALVSPGSGSNTFALLDERLDPELSFLSIGGRRVVDGDIRLFSFEDSLGFSRASKGLVGVGVTELSSEYLLLGE